MVTANVYGYKREISSFLFCSLMEVRLSTFATVGTVVSIIARSTCICTGSTAAEIPGTLKCEKEKRDKITEIPELIVST